MTGDVQSVDRDLTRLVHMEEVDFNKKSFSEKQNLAQKKG
jgi:hypothetical protein